MTLVGGDGGVVAILSSTPSSFINLDVTPPSLKMLHNMCRSIQRSVKAAGKIDGSYHSLKILFIMPYKDEPHSNLLSHHQKIYRSMEP